VRKTSLILLGFFLVGGCLSACKKATGVLEACHSYEHMRACDAHLREKMPIQIDCKKLQGKFEDCPQQDIDYAAKSFAQDEKTLCDLYERKKACEAHTNKDEKLSCSNTVMGEFQGFRKTFDAKKISPICYQAATDCGPECFQTGLDDIP
jgi:hypothetical protein